MTLWYILNVYDKSTVLGWNNFFYNSGRIKIKRSTLTRAGMLIGGNSLSADD